MIAWVKLMYLEDIVNLISLDRVFFQGIPVYIFHPYLLNKIQERQKKCSLQKEGTFQNNFLINFVNLNIQ